MAMLITKFHRLIRNRLLWLAFLIIVVFSFVIWGTQMPETGAQGPNAAGRLNGEDVSFETYQQARFNTYLSLVLMTGRTINITPEIEEQLHDLAWQRIVTLREAKAMGILTSNDEVVNTIRSLEFLHQDGRFTQEAYDQFDKQFLAQFRASKRQFEEHIREEIILQKFRAVIDRLHLVTPLEVNRTYNTLTDQFTVEYVKVPPSLVEADVTVSEEEIRSLYDKDPEQFKQPERVSVKAAVFPVQDFIGSAEISDEDIQTYYDTNLDDFAKPSETPEDTNAFSLAATEYFAIEDVRDQIVTNLQVERAGELAAAKAAGFVQELSYQREAGTAAFDQVAATQGVQLVKTSLFSNREVPSELENATIELTSKAFNLSDDSDYYYSDPITVTNFVYVLALEERQPSRIPEFEEVQAEVGKMAREFEAYNTLMEKAQEIQGSIVAGLAAGISFDDVIKEYNLEAIKPASFSINSENIDPEISANLIRPLLVLNAGEVTDVVAADDFVMIAHVKERKPAEGSTVDALRPQIIGTLRRQSSAAAFTDYQKYLLTKNGFEDLNRRVRSSDEQETETETADEGA